MTTRDDASDSESENIKCNGSNDTSNTTATINPNTSQNWFLSIPRRIGKFISKQSRRQSANRLHTQRQNNNSINISNADAHRGLATNQIETFADNMEGTDETNLYSMVDYMGNDEEVAMIRACSQMARYGWFWGPISRHTAQQRLHGTPNGSFLVRNSQINLHNFTISFRTAGKTLHYRIEFVDGYWQTFSSKHRSVVDLIEDAMKKSKENVFCYVKQSSQLIPPFPVRLTHPVSHFGDIPSLQNMCRMVIQKNVDVGKMDMLPLPNKLILYCKEWETIYGEMPIRVGQN